MDYKSALTFRTLSAFVYRCEASGCLLSCLFVASHRRQCLSAKAVSAANVLCWCIGTKCTQAGTTFA